MNLSEELKTATSLVHPSLEDSDFFKVLKVKSLPIESYTNYLQAMAGVHGAFEKEIAISEHPLLSIVWQENRKKLPALLQDLESLHSTQIKDIPLAIDAMLDAIKFIRLSRIENPLSLLGIMYVLEGSTLGGTIQKTMILKNFNFTGRHGVQFLDCYQDNQMYNWDEFKTKINSLSLSEVDRKSIVQTACDFFEKIKTIFFHLYPISKTVPFYNITTLNPEAGRYEIPKDVEEIYAALRAGVITWEQFPYYEWRYGLRGKQYTRSDSVWLVTLCDLEEELVIKQVKWLGRVLASRGMPQRLLTIHLYNLVHELENVHPEKKDLYHKLLTASEVLNKMFMQVFTENKVVELISKFESLVGEEWNQKLKNMALILIAAVADEKNGIENALSSVEFWAKDENRFPPIWINAVQVLIQSATKKI